MKLKMAAEQAIEMTRRNQEKKDREWYIIHSMILSNQKTESQISDEKIKHRKEVLKIIKIVAMGTAGYLILAGLMTVL